MKFTKMHGLGNDYVYVDLFHERVEQPEALARAISDRHLGVGGDGLILIVPSKAADVRMEMYNADGSRGRMCGNGIRCVAKYAVEHGLAAGPELRIETDDGVKQVWCQFDGTNVVSVKVDMGKPRLAPVDIPVQLRGERIVNQLVKIRRTDYRLTCVSMGNPHAIVFVDQLGGVRPALDAPTNIAQEPLPLRKELTGRVVLSDPLSAMALNDVGPAFQECGLFPHGVNVHFVHVECRQRVIMRTWERGSGLTRACGTGACAVAVAGVLTGRTDRIITATLPGGDLLIEWDDDDHVHMTGPAVEVYNGEWPNDHR